MVLCLLNSAPQLVLLSSPCRCSLHQSCPPKSCRNRTEHPNSMRLLSERRGPKVRLVHPGGTHVDPAAGNHFSCVKSFVIRTSKTPFPQTLYNPHFRDPLVSADSKQLTGPDFLPQPFYNQHLQAPLGSAGNKGLINPVESALTKNPPATPLESALPKNRGVGVLWLTGRLLRRRRRRTRLRRFLPRMVK